MNTNCLRIAFATVFSLVASSTFAQFDSGSDGSDGDLVCPPECNPGEPCTQSINLALATTSTWQAPSLNSGRGVYDPAQWAVVFKYSSVNVKDGCTIKFLNHPSGASVVWLVSNTVVINGRVDLTGGNGHGANQLPFYAEPGPGGFAGTIAQSIGAGGFGPGGGTAGRIGGSFGSVGSGNSPNSIYGNEQLLPLIGGSGGSTNSSATYAGAGAGGGAILIASGTPSLPLNSRITVGVNGRILCNGGSSDGNNYGGSGGAIRLLAGTIEGPGRLEASGGGGGGVGRIRLEAVNPLLLTNTSPNYTFATPPGPVFPPVNSPELWIASVDGIPVPDDPVAGITTEDVGIQDDGQVYIHIGASNVPEGAVIRVRIVPVRGSVIDVTSTPLKGMGDGTLTAAAVATFPPGRSEIQLQASW